MTEIISQINNWKETTKIDNHLCRICLSLSDLLIPIFANEGLEQKLAEKIEKYLPVKISTQDFFPKKICYPCAGAIVAWDALYNIFIKTDQKLKLIFSKRNESSTENFDSEEEPLIIAKKKKETENSLTESDNNLENLAVKCETSKQNCFLIKKFKRGLKVDDEMADDSKNLGKVESEKTDNEAKENTNNNNNNNNKVENETVENESLTALVKTESSLKEADSNKNEGVKEGSDAVVNEASIKCEFCSKFYKDKKSLMRHQKKVHEKSKLMERRQCDMCGNKYKTKANLDRHYLKEHLTNQVDCPVCRTPFNSKKLDSHLKSVHGVKTENKNEEKFKCKMCEKRFKNKYVRNSHVKEVHLCEPTKCKLCNFEGVQSALRRHWREVHAEKKFLCSLCPGAFKTLHTLKMHMTSHSDIRCYTCDICGMGFKRLNNVRDHMKCHEEKSNQCQICGNFFARKRYLAIHEKTIHNFYADGIVPEEKGFECGTCGARLKWKKNLLAHMRIHTGEKPYVCKVCNKDFICHGSLRTHMAKHSAYVLNESDPQKNMAIEVNVFKNFNPENA